MAMKSNDNAGSGPGQLMAAALLLTTGTLAGVAASQSEVVRFVVITMLYASAFILAIVSLRFRNLRLVALFGAVLFVIPVVVLCVLSPLRGSEIVGLPDTDRLNYFYAYQSLDLQSVSEVMEGGFVLIVALLRDWVPFPVFLVAIALLFVVAVLRFMFATGAKELAPIMVLVLIAYFPFWGGALNVTRQFLAGSLIIFALSFLLGEKQRWIAAITLIVAAILIHTSAFVFAALPALFLFKRKSVAIKLLWVSNATFFALSIIGVSPIMMLSSVFAKISTYSDIGSDSMYDAVLKTKNRLDFATFIAAPMLLYVYIRVQKSKRDFKILDQFALLYSLSCMPYFWLSFLFHSDRLAYFAFIFAPMFLIYQAGYLRTGWQRWGVPIGIAVLCVAHFSVGLYGYTPKELFLG